MKGMIKFNILLKVNFYSPMLSDTMQYIALVCS
jgi:hypothetical protein